MPLPTFVKDAESLRERLGSLPEAVERPALVMISGLPGTGKSYFARRLAERCPAVILDSDALRKVLFPQPAHSMAENKRLFPAINLLMERLLRKGIPVILDATNLLEFQREYVYRIADRTGAKLIVVQTEAPEDLVASRLGGRERGVNPKDVSEANWQVYEKMKQNAEKIRRNHFVVDTSRDITPVVEKVLREIRKAT